MSDRFQNHKDKRIKEMNERIRNFRGRKKYKIKSSN
jgi:hypothetical protein